MKSQLIAAATVHAVTMARVWSVLGLIPVPAPLGSVASTATPNSTSVNPTLALMVRPVITTPVATVVPVPLDSLERPVRQVSITASTSLALMVEHALMASWRHPVSACQDLREHTVRLILMSACHNLVSMEAHVWTE